MSADRWTWWALDDEALAHRYPALARRARRRGRKAGPKPYREFPLGDGRVVRFALPPSFTLEDVRLIWQRLAVEVDALEREG